MGRNHVPNTAGLGERFHSSPETINGPHEGENEGSSSELDDIQI